VSPAARQHAGYLFDLDGTLIDTAPDIVAALNHALEHHGMAPVPDGQVRQWVGQGARRLTERALADQRRDPAEVDTVLADFIAYYEAHIADRSRPYPGVVSTLERLARRGAGLGVVTNKLQHLSERVLEALELSRYFAVLVGGDRAARPKPDAAPVLLACDTLALAPAQVLFVGDSTTDVGAARNAGCPVVCVPYGYSQGVAAEDLGADALIDSFDDLP